MTKQTNLNLTKEHQIVTYIKDYLTPQQWQHFLDNNGMQIIEAGIKINKSQQELFDQYYEVPNGVDNDIMYDVVNDFVLYQEQLLFDLVKNYLIVKTTIGLQYFCSCEYPHSGAGNNFAEMFDELFDLQNA